MTWWEDAAMFVAVNLKAISHILVPDTVQITTDVPEKTTDNPLDFISRGITAISTSFPLLGDITGTFTNLIVNPISNLFSSGIVTPVINTFRDYIIDPILTEIVTPIANIFTFNYFKNLWAIISTNIMNEIVLAFNTFSTNLRSIL